MQISDQTKSGDGSQLSINVFKSKICLVLRKLREIQISYFVHNGFQTVTAQLFLISISFLCSFVICCLFVCLLTSRLSKIYCWEGSATTATYVLVNSTKNGKKKFNLNLKHEGIIFLHQIFLSIQIINYILLFKKFFKRFRLINGLNRQRRECGYTQVAHYNLVAVSCYELY